MKIVRFGESIIGGMNWYESESGRVDCTDKEIHSIWMAWVCKEGSTRDIIDGEIVFTFKEPFELNSNA